MAATSGAGRRIPPAAGAVGVTHRGRRIYRLDLGLRERRLGLEYDGEEHHTQQRDLVHDELRHEHLRQLGWTVLAFHRGHVLGRGMELERAIGEVLATAPGITRRAW